MPSQTNKQALAPSVEKRLNGTSARDIKASRANDSFVDHEALYCSGKGYFLGNPGDFNPKYTIGERTFLNISSH